MILTIHSILLFERLTDRSYFGLDLSNDDDISVLCYCALVSRGELRSSLSDFMQEYKKSGKWRIKYTRELIREVSFLSQFSNLQNESLDGVSDNDTAERKVSDIVYWIIVHGGIDIRFVLDEMPIWMLNSLTEALNDKMKRDLEMSRLWTFLSVVPHLSDKSGIKHPRDLCPFDWEDKKDVSSSFKDEMAEYRLKSIRENIEMSK